MVIESNFVWFFPLAMTVLQSIRAQRGRLFPGGQDPWGSLWDEQGWLIPAPQPGSRAVPVVAPEPWHTAAPPCSEMTLHWLCPHPGLYARVPGCVANARCCLVVYF